MENFFKLFLTASFFTTVGISSTYIYFSNKPLSNTKSSLTEIYYTTQLEEKIATISSENKMLKQQLESSKKIPLENSKEKPEDTKNLNRDASVNTYVTDDIDMSKEKITTLKAEKFGKWILDSTKNNPNFNIGIEMKNRFDAEKFDNDWAPDKEQQLANFFSEKVALNGFALKEAKCRTNLCQISVGITDIEQANTLVEHFSKLLGDDKKTTTLIAAPNEQKNTTVLYVLRDENSFEIN